MKSQNLFEFFSRRDESLAHYPLLKSTWTTPLLVLAYWCFVKKIGPRMMEHRRPFQLKGAMQIYNLMQVVCNFIAARKGIEVMVASEVTCVRDHIILNNSWVYYMVFVLKVFDFMDTIFMVLRKNNRQITFLHVYHHCLMVLCAWMIMTFYGVGGNHVFMGTLNCSVHCAMYSYYWLSARYPRVKESQWKRYLTIAQLMQFVIIWTHVTYTILFRRDCEYPLFLSGLIWTQSVFMLFLFGKFYVKTYLKPSKESK